MELSQIQGFVAVAKAGSLSQATKLLHVTQPALSRRISLLENELKGPLFERLSQGVVLTDSGKTFLPFAEKVLASLQDGKHAVADLQQQHKGQLTVALVGSLASSNLVGLLSQFRQHFPNIVLQLHTDLSAGVSDMVVNGEAHMGLRYFLDPRAGLQLQLISHEPLVLCASTNHPQRKQIEQGSADWASFDWIGFSVEANSNQLSYGRLLRDQLSKVGVTLNKLTNCDSLTAQKRLIEAGFGLGLLPLSSIQEEIALGSLCAISESDLQCSVPIYLIRRDQGYLSHAAQQLESYLQQHWQGFELGQSPAK